MDDAASGPRRRHGRPGSAQGDPVSSGEDTGRPEDDPPAGPGRKKRSAGPPVPDELRIPAAQTRAGAARPPAPPAPGLVGAYARG